MENDFEKAANQLVTVSALAKKLDEKTRANFEEPIKVVNGILKLAKSIAADKPFLDASVEEVFGRK